MASGVLRRVSISAQCIGGDHEIRRPRVLRGVVEQSERWHILEDLEQACLSFHEEAYLCATGGKRLEL